MRSLRWLLIAVAPLLAAHPLPALETDQYLAWFEEIEDSSAPINEFLNQGIRESLARVNDFYEGEPPPCTELPIHIYEYLFQGMHGSRLRKFVNSDPRIDRFPGKETKYFQYLEQSVFRKPAPPFLLPLGRTIMIDDVHFGVDKFGHIFGFGRRLYKHYLQARHRGHDEEEATRRAVMWGFKIERSFVGMLTDGVFSHADMEANYQGLLLSRDLCETEPPHLALEGTDWVLAREVDIADYVNPAFDESFLNNHYAGFRWKRVRPVLLEEYCPLYLDEAVQARMARYRARHTPSVSQQLIDGHYARKGRNPRLEQSLEAICPETRPGVLEAQRSEPAPVAEAGGSN